MRGGVVVGDQGEGGWSSSIPDRGGVRWSLFFGARRMGERVVLCGIFVGHSCSIFVVVVGHACSIFVVVVGHACSVLSCA